MLRGIVSGLLILLSCLATDGLAQQPGELRMMTGPQGGSWYPLGGAIAEVIKREVGVTVSVRPGGGIANVEAVEVGRAEIGFSNLVSAIDAAAGRAPFKAATRNMVHWMNLYPQYFQMVVLEESGVKTVADLKGKGIAPGPRGFTGEQMARHVLQVYGLSYRDMGSVQHVRYADAVALMKDKHLHAFLPVTTIPASSIMDLGTVRPIRLLSVPDDKLKELQKINSGYIRRGISKGTYPGVNYDVQTFGTFTHLVISRQLPEELVYQMTRAVVQQVARLGDVVKDMKGVTARDLAVDVGVPFHPGAERYFREARVR
ncbi:MAG: TAXI family TRAP transporter solute-binding subunit [Deltaproteobacteria bacterium]|nr:TAXI family TRAP transporter solute-binding subunit [Deltaproteobacteria bacterium]